MRSRQTSPRQTPRRKSYYIRIFLLLFLGTAGIVLLLEGLLFIGLENQYRRNARTLQESLILQVQQGTETLLKQAEKLSVSLAMHSELVRFTLHGFDRQEYDLFVRSMVLLGLTVTGSVGEFVHSVYIYNPDTGRMLTPDGLMDAMYSDDRQFLRSGEYSQSLRKWRIGRSVVPNKSVITYISSIPLSGETGTVLVLNLREEFFERNFYGLFEQFGSVLVIEDKSGRVYSNVSDTKFHEAITRSGHAEWSKSKIGKINERSYFVTTIASAYSGWSYHTFTPIERIASVSRNIVQLLLAAIFVFILISLGLSLVLAKVIYSPVAHLRETVAELQSGSTPLGTGGNEITAIEEYFVSLHSRNVEYHETYEKNRRILREKLYWDLLHGRMFQIENRLISEAEIDVNRSRKVFVAVIEYAPDMQDTEHLWMLMCTEIIRWSVENVDAPALFGVFDYRQIVLCLPDEEPDLKMGKVRSLHGYLKQTSTIPFYLSVGRTVDSLSQLYVSYDNAEELLALKHLMPHTAVLYEENPLLENRNDAGLGAETFTGIEDQVSAFRNFLDAGEIEKARTIADAILFETGEDTGLYYRQAKMFQFANILFNYMVRRNSDEFFFTGRDSPWRTFNRIEDLEQLKAWFGQWFEKIQVYADGREGNQQYRHVESCREYLKSNFARPISIQDAADAVGINSAYLSTLFKKEMSVSFSDYLQSLRLEEATRLLHETNETIEAIAERTGFSSKQHIIRVFKRAYGCTPGTYRTRNG